MDKIYYDYVEDGTYLYWSTLAKARGIGMVTLTDYSYVISVSGKGPSRIFGVNRHIQEQRLGEIVSRIRERRLPDGILLTDRQENRRIISILHDMGVPMDTSGMCMAINLRMAAFPPDVSDHLRLVKIQNIEELSECQRIVSEALFGFELMSLEQFSDLCNLANTTFYLAYCGDFPVSTCMAIRDGSLATIEMVSTLPDYRRRGIAAALVRLALSELKQTGVKTATLRAEPDGINVYQRIGFEEVCRRIVAMALK